jgi:hypothetical protein
MKNWKFALIGGAIGLVLAYAADKLLLTRQDQMQIATMVFIAFFMALLFGIAAWRINITGVAAHSR